MPDPPLLPDSPLTAQEETLEDPRAITWRRHVVATSTALLCAVPAGVAALWVQGRTVSYRGSPDWGGLMLSLLFGSPNVLLGLIGLQVVAGSSRRGLPATILTGLFATASAVGHGLVVVAQVAAQINEALAYYVSGLLAAALVLSLPIARRLLSRSLAQIVLIVGLAVPPCVFAAVAAHTFPHPPDPWMLAWLATTVPVPIAGAIALAMLIRGAPTAPGDSL